MPAELAEPSIATSTAPAPAPSNVHSSGHTDPWAVERSRIDASASGPVLLFFFTALAWLLVATIFNFISSYQLQNPNFLADWAMLTNGRVVPAYNVCLKYGWASLVGMGVAIWLMARLCRAEVKFPGALVFGALFWNFGLILAVLGILIGNNTGLEMMELPRKAVWPMFIGYFFIGVSGAALYKQRKTTSVFISVWYLLGAFFWFPWRSEEHTS